MTSLEASPHSVAILDRMIFKTSYKYTHNMLTAQFLKRERGISAKGITGQSKSFNKRNRTFTLKQPDFWLARNKKDLS